MAVCGCNQGFFAAHGDVESRGGVLGNWRSVPQGCSRDPLDGLPVGQSATVATFLWEDPAAHDPDKDRHRATAADAPLRMEITRLGSGYSASFTTVRKAGVEVTSAQCSEFTVDTYEQAARVAGALPALDGLVRLSCVVGGGAVQADVRFSRCEF